MLVMFFGLPGAGKTFAGEVLRDDFGFTFHEADDDIPDDYRRRVLAGQVVGEPMRDAYHRQLLDRMAELKLAHPRLAVAAPLLRDRHRQWIRARFPDTVFVLVESDETAWRSRLSQRSHTISLEYAQKVASLYEPVTVQYERLDNSQTGPETVKAQLQAILERHGI